MKLVLKNIIKLAKDALNIIFQDSFNKILSQQITHDRSYISLDNVISLHEFSRLVTSIFSFPHNVFNPIRDKNHPFS